MSWWNYVVRHEKGDPLHTVIIHGDDVGVGSASTYRHDVGEGEYIFEHACIEPDQTNSWPTLCTFQFIPLYTEVAQKTIWLGSGYAADDNYPLIIVGPVAVTGPGYFLASMKSLTTNDAIEGSFSYRKVKSQ